MHNPISHNCAINPCYNFAAITFSYELHHQGVALAFTVQLALLEVVTLHQFAPVRFDNQ